MIVGNYRQAFKAAIARIYHSNGAIVGAGFLVSDRHLLTCAHVVSAALGIAPETVEMPTTTLELDFPLIAPGQKVKAKVAFWQPVNPTQVGEDIAGLELEEALTEGQPVRLLTVEELWNHPFQIFGFPSKRDEGIWASGVIRDRLANGWVQIEDIKAQGQAVQPGFSGSPIWDEVLQGVVGMAVAADKKRDETKTAFMIPTTILTKAWAELGQSVQSSEISHQDLKSQSMKDFFVSYNRADKQWAEWIAWTLEESGYSVVIQAWDFRPGGNFVLDMQRAAAESQKTIAVLSDSYLKSSFTQPEWAAAFAQDPQSLERKLLPVRVKECKPTGLLAPIVYVDLVGKSEVEATQIILDGLKQRVKPEQKTGFPGMDKKPGFAGMDTGGHTSSETPRFPDSPIQKVKSGLSRVQQIKCKARQERLDSLTSDYEAGCKQFEFALSEVDRTRLKRQLVALEEEMTQVEDELKELCCE